jgi:hypothetical protein
MIEVVVGQKVLAYQSNKDKYVEGEVVRVYDEAIYEKEHYTDLVRPANLNEILVDVKLSDRVSKAHFAWGLREIESVREA